MLYLRTYVCSAYVYILLTMNIIKKAIGGGSPTAFGKYIRYCEYLMYKFYHKINKLMYSLVKVLHY